jgi:hypothetical protein
MNNLKMYCLCLENELLNKVEKLNYLPVGLGKNKFEDRWIRDNTGNNISDKNKYYGEYSFHYWLWKNIFKEIDENDWIGFCTYRRFWLNENNETNSELKFEDKILKEIPKIWKDYDVILAEKIIINNIKFMKMIKHGKLTLIKNPKFIFKKERNIKFQFDLFHGVGILDKAIEVLNMNDREDFRQFVYENNSFNQANLFICKSKKILNKYYENIFEWLENCEKVFGFNLEGYGKVRIYAFLAERFLPFWFNKYANCLEWPILFNDLRNEELNK